METITLVSNPGSASRKYSLFAGQQLRASLHFEYQDEALICTLFKNDTHTPVSIRSKALDEVIDEVEQLFRLQGALVAQERIERIGLRVVAPDTYFTRDREITDEVIEKLQALQPFAPLHIDATLHELHGLQTHFSDSSITGVSDSQFQATKPEHAWYYGIPREDADRYNIKRFGYHGLSMASVIRSLQEANITAKKLVVCHLGSGASVTAIQDGRCIDTTMGYSPLEGLIMSTRSGNLDPTAALALKRAHQLSDEALDTYLNTESGLKGLGGSDDIRILLQRETAGDRQATLALATYVYTIQKAIGQMVAVLNGLDALIFTGTVGERSVPIRQRVTSNLSYIGITVDDAINDRPTVVDRVIRISPGESPAVYIVAADEAAEIAQRAEAR